MIDSPFLAVAVLGIGGLVVGLLRLLIAALCSSWRASPFDALLLSAWAAGAAWFGFPPVFWLTALGLMLVWIARSAWISRHLRQVCTGLCLILTHSASLALAMTGLGLGLVLWILQANNLEFDTEKWLEEIEEVKVGVLTDEAAAAIGYTDQHRRIPLFSPNDLTDTKIAKLGEQEKKLLADWFNPPRILQVDALSAYANCHGWTFTRGRYMVRGQDVPSILEDNGYHLVDVPKPNDVIVYELVPGQVSHTGIVHSVSKDGLILVESKWGKAGRYLHQPKDQPYSKTYVYYRSAREGHSLLGLGSQNLVE